VPFSEYEKFKWESLEHLAHRTGLGGVWLEVTRLTDDPTEQAALVKRLVLELFDDGLVFGTYATYPDAYNLAWPEFTRVSRAIIERELDSETRLAGDPDTVPSFWIFPTYEGERASLAQPADAFFTAYTDEQIASRRRFDPERPSA
jgi:hypothetical protein